MLILLHIPLFSLQNFEEFSHGKVFHAQQSQEKKNSLGAKFFTAPVPEYRARTLEEFNARVPNFQSEESGLFDDLQPGQIDPFINQQELNIGQTVPVFPVQSKSVRVNPYPKKNPRKRSPLINGQSAVPTSTPVSWT